MLQFGITAGFADLSAGELNKEDASGRSGRYEECVLDRAIGRIYTILYTFSYYSTYS
jgi:hypothetical protein